MTTFLRCLAAFTFSPLAAVAQELPSSDAPARRSDGSVSKRAAELDSLVVDHAARYIASGRSRRLGSVDAANAAVSADAAAAELLEVASPPKAPRFMRRQRQVHLGGEDGDYAEGMAHAASSALSDDDGYERVDCGLSTWTSFTPCSKTCGLGERERTRYIKPARNGGKACEYATLSEKFTCNAHECPENCLWSQWGAWGECSRTCGRGEKTRSRSKSGPRHGGGDCAGVETSGLACNSFACPRALFARNSSAAEDCYFQPWSDWGACTKTCVEGTEFGYMTRDRAKVGPFNGGAECEGHTTDDNHCNEFSCPKDCEAGEWSLWSTCSQSCSVSVATHGYKIRSRTATAATNGGKECAANWEMEHCNNQLCASDCDFLEWGAWGPCSRSCTVAGEAPGQKVRVRSMVGPAEGGKACGGNTEMKATCNDFPCPAECTWGPWGNFGACSKTCGMGGRTRTRSRAGGGAAEGGADCSGPSQHWEACNGESCPVDCKWTEWNAWMPCTRSCGFHGTRQRARSYDPSPSSGGAECAGSFVELAECNMHPCPVDCLYEDWLEWSLCSVSCDDGVKVRTRLKQIAAFFGGSECADEATEEASCNYLACPLDCRHSEWGNWTECSATCGQGTRTSYRVLLTAENGGSEECPEGDLNQTEECNEVACPPEKSDARSPQGRLAWWFMLAATFYAVAASESFILLPRSFPA